MKMITNFPVLAMHKYLTTGVRKAVRIRLEALLEAEEKTYHRWQENVKPKLIKTRQRDLDRRFRKIITALKIVIHTLTPYDERKFDEPNF